MMTKHGTLTINLTNKLQVTGATLCQFTIALTLYIE